MTRGKRMKRISTDLSWEQRNPTNYFYRRPKAINQLKEIRRLSLKHSRRQPYRMAVKTFPAIDVGRKTGKVKRRIFNDAGLSMKKKLRETSRS